MLSLITCRGTAKDRCCSRVCGMARTFQGYVGNCSDGDLSTVPMGYCRFCMRRKNGASGQIPSFNKAPTKGVERRNTHHGNRALDASRATENYWKIFQHPIDRSPSHSFCCYYYY
ncbi:hypothetical protein AVEN_151696-1 [Araneus ventricosus]|uniref:Uncharacterized protein n=1 Tax=Araneus ventricosus TaxID=182803 RepID=A0A4Y2MTE7_ARAVE|nr:hypothetical protein AVEN_151696-1 [Araneus ventricosus]